MIPAKHAAIVWLLSVDRYPVVSDPNAATIRQTNHEKSVVQFRSRWFLYRTRKMRNGMRLRIMSVGLK